MRILLVIVFLLLSAFSSACSDTSNVEGRWVYTGGTEVDDDGVTTQPLAMPFDHYDRNGKHWECLNEAKFKTLTEAELKAGGVGNETTVTREEARDTPRLEELDVEELALGLRNVMPKKINGKVYDCADDYKYDLAYKIKDGKPRESTQDDGAPPDVANTSVEKDCCGNDDRYPAISNQFYPRIGLTEVGCTVNFTGSQSAISAAHCFFDADTNEYYNFGSDFPYIRREETVDDDIPETYWCYAAFIPYNWRYLGDNTNFNWDFTVLDFTRDMFLEECDYVDEAPIEAWFGVLGTPLTDSQIEDGRTLKRIGYPAHVNLSHGSINSGWTTMYTIDGGRVVDGVPYSHPMSTSFNAIFNMIFDRVDATSGDSGSALIWTDTSDQERIISVHHGHTSEPENVERRLDVGVYDYLDDNTPFPSD